MKSTPYTTTQFRNSTSCHVGVASLNQTAGDWRGNRYRIIEVIHQARARGIRLLLCPELCISGYSLGDRLPRTGTFEQSYQSLLYLKTEVKDLIVCVGLPILHRGVIFNAVAVLAEGEIVGLCAKETLATGDVEYEDRWYQAWSAGHTEEWIAPDGASYPLGNLIFEADGVGRFAFEICEDAWRGVRPGSRYALEGAELILNPSASWFSIGKHAVRRQMVIQSSREDYCAYLYASLLGADNTRLIFDGSLFIALNGSLISEGDRFRFTDSVLMDAVIDLSEIRMRRREAGSWRQQVNLNITEKMGGCPPTIIKISGDYFSDQSSLAPQPDWIPNASPIPDPSLTWLESCNLFTKKIATEDLSHLELELALCIGLRDYLKKAQIDKVALALSGGRDSAMVALLVSRMLHYDNPTASIDKIKQITQERFLCAYLSTENSGPETQNAARALAEELGAHFYNLNIQQSLDAHRTLIEGAMGRTLQWDIRREDLALQNVQARLRGSVIWFLANLHNALLLATSNKSEAAVGYTTMDGDTSGGLSPIADVPKSLVSLWLKWAYRSYNIEALSLINGLEPTAELRPPSDAQTDEADLMPFEVLDRLLYGFAQLGQDPIALFKSLWPEFKDRYQGQAHRFTAHIHKFIRLFCFAQWKRERFAISFRVSSFDLDPKGGGRYPVIQAPFTEELEALDAYIEQTFNS